MAKKRKPKIHYAKAGLHPGGGMRLNERKKNPKIHGLRSEPRKCALTDVDKGGRPSFEAFVQDLALQRLKAGNYPDTLEEFRDELKCWIDSLEPLEFKDPPAACTIEEHIRELWRQRHQWPQRRG
jgi:hypothetical protein